MEIKKLNKKDLDEGLTLDFVNNINLKKQLHSPVLFDFKDDPVKTLVCSGGYWVSFGGGNFAKDKDGSLLVYKEREIKVARARYLFKNPEPKTKKQDFEAPEPMFTARFDNHKEMEVLKNVFHVDKMNEANWDMDKIKINLEFEKEKHGI